jgi:hypothetical protein
VLCELGQRLGVPNMDYLGIFHVQREAARLVELFSPLADPPSPLPEPTPVLYGPARP